MARTAAGEALTARQMRMQLGIRAATIRDLIKILPAWDPFDPDSQEAIINAVYVLAQARGLNSGAVAARYYEMFREVDLSLTAGKAIAIAEPPSLMSIRAAFAATARDGFFRAIFNGQTPEQAMATATVKLSGAITRNVLNTGRETIVEGARLDDRYVHGWIRVSDGDPCAFCAMLLSRGPVYWTEESAGGLSDEGWHDHCACSVEPYVSGTPWPARNQEMHDLWNKTAYADWGDHRGTSNDALNAFRRALSSTGQAEDGLPE